ncbi:MAG: dephospho-CoA kinase [Dehalococcoidia bacterium]|nr:MAG: dephospho-CoA kinase [Dehalococcoidia bacterium]
MRVIGITGTIGSGKSTVAGFLGELGARVIDADEVGHEVYLPGTDGWKAVVEAFGEGVIAPDGTVDRHKLGEIVFKNPAALAKLNSIVHPLITKKVQSRLKELRQKETRIVVLEAALLIEAGWSPLVDEIWVTTAPESVIHKRLAAKRELSHSQIQARIKMQLPLSEQTKWAGRVIDTNIPLPELETRVAALWRKLKQKTDSS